MFKLNPLPAYKKLLLLLFKKKQSFLLFHCEWTKIPYFVHILHPAVDFTGYHYILHSFFFFFVAEFIGYYSPLTSAFSIIILEQHTLQLKRKVK